MTEQKKPATTRRATTRRTKATDETSKTSDTPINEVSNAVEKAPPEPETPETTDDPAQEAQEAASEALRKRFTTPRGWGALRQVDTSTGAPTNLASAYGILADLNKNGGNSGNTD